MKLGTEMRQGVRDITLASRIFLVVAVASLVIAIALLAYNQGAFTPTIRVFFYAGTADGMNTGMAVKLVGFKVGAVGGIAIEPDLRVKVVLKVDARYADMIDLDAVVRLTKEAIIGGNILEIRPGSGNRGPIADRAILRYEREPALEGAIVALVDQVSPIVGDVKQITAYLSSPDSDFRQAIVSINRAAISLAEASVHIRQLVTASAKQIEKGGERAGAVLETADTLLRDAGASLVVLDGSLRKVDAALPGMTSKMDQSLDNIRAMSEALRGMVTGELPGLVGEAGVLISDTNTVMRGAKQAWPVRNMVQPPQERLLQLDSGGGLPAASVDRGRDR